MTKTKKVPFQFKNEVKNGKHVLTLSGNVQKKYWRDDDVINAKDIRESLDTVTDDIVIKLNSPGGDVFEGIEIYNYLKDHPSNITVEVTGLAASAASIVAMGADELVMNIGTSLMVHEASTILWGNKTEIAKELKALETIDTSLVDIYADKTKQSAEVINNWITEETWFTAENAVESKLADRVKNSVKAKVEVMDISTMINDSVAKILKGMEFEEKPKETVNSMVLKNLQKLGGIN